MKKLKKISIKFIKIHRQSMNNLQEQVIQLQVRITELDNNNKSKKRRRLNFKFKKTQLKTKEDVRDTEIKNSNKINTDSEKLEKTTPLPNPTPRRVVVYH